MVTNLKKIFSGLKICGKKMTSSCNFIDFYVHDILDYTMLNKDDQSFQKDMKLFNIKVAIDKIHEIQEDKVDLKNINVRISFKGFEQSEFVKTDQRRL